MAEANQVAEFLSPSQRVDIDYRRQLACIQQRQNVRMRDVNTTEQQKEFIVAECQKQRAKLLEFKETETKRIKAITKQIGSGCECHQVVHNPELEKVLQEYAGRRGPQVFGAMPIAESHGPPQSGSASRQSVWRNPAGGRKPCLSSLSPLNRIQKCIDTLQFLLE